jgi:hypothetical protein
MYEIYQLASYMGRASRETEVFPPFFLVFIDHSVIDFKGEPFVLYPAHVKELGECLWNNAHAKQLFVEPHMFKNLVESAVVFADCIDRYWMLRDCCRLERLNGYVLQDALFEKVVFSMNVYKYGRVKKLVYFR